MTKAQRQRFAGYVREVADLMGLCAWTISVEFDDELSGDDDETQTLAQSVVVPGRQVNEIEFRSDILERDPPAVRHAVVHELLHSPFGAMWEQVRSDLAGTLGREAYTLFVDSFRRNMEHGVDAVAVAWSERLPLPPKEIFG